LVITFVANDSVIGFTATMLIGVIVIAMTEMFMVVMMNVITLID
jgi:hypothetical protein